MYAQLVVSYQGSYFKGFQKQVNTRTVVGEIEKALKLVFKQPVSIVGAGRTDTGVHALEQVISFHLPFKIEAIALKKALNSLVCEDIAVSHIYIHAQRFHALQHAVSRTYHYLFSSEVLPIYLKPYVAEFILKDYEKLKHTLSLFQGSFAFKAFSKHNPSLKGGLRHIDSCTLTSKVFPSLFDSLQDINIYCIEIKANAFLHHMIRHIVGASWAVDQERLTHTDISNMLNSNKKLKSWTIAPSKGLWLKKVEY